MSANKVNSYISLKMKLCKIFSFLIITIFMLGITESLPQQKLLIILLDGFRWNYYTRQSCQLPGLSQFVSKGVHAEWVEPNFPSLSFPTWSTISTGLYPEEHNINGNYILHRNGTDDELSGIPESVFSIFENTTKLHFWWQFAEPIWITATKRKRKVYLANWARSDVPFHGILPAEATGYVTSERQPLEKGSNLRFPNDLQTALYRLDKDGFSLAMVYDDYVDRVGHEFGPDSTELKQILRQRDGELQELLKNIEKKGLQNKINVVIISDHGMTKVDESVKRVYLQNYLDMDQVYKIIDFGPFVGISAMSSNNTTRLEQRLASIRNEGVAVYSKKDMPEELHYKGGKFVPDFVLVANPGSVLVGVKSEKQIPNYASAYAATPYLGVHGYHNFSDMRTIFFGKGPAFKVGKKMPSFRIVDEYQIFMKVLGLSPKPNHGKWDSVKDMFINP